ncbi:hypothetical protein HAX54_026944, partial [Datura stramonium]|nr:hypothetical protein [Datura stramonium]
FWHTQRLIVTTYELLVPSNGSSPSGHDFKTSWYQPFSSLEFFHSSDAHPTTAWYGM